MSLDVSQAYDEQNYPGTKKASLQFSPVYRNRENVILETGLDPDNSPRPPGDTIDKYKNKYVVVLTPPDPATGTIIDLNDRYYPEYAYGQTAGFQPIPADGYEFTGWTGDASGTLTPLFFQVQDDTSLSGDFNLT